MAGDAVTNLQMKETSKVTAFLAKWKIIRPALKEHGATLHAKDGRHWLLMRLKKASGKTQEIVRLALQQRGETRRSKDGRHWLVMWVEPEIVRQILSHPAIVADDEAADTHQCFRWRPASLLWDLVHPNRGTLQ